VQPKSFLACILDVVFVERIYPCHKITNSFDFAVSYFAVHDATDDTHIRIHIHIHQSSHPPIHPSGSLLLRKPRSAPTADSGPEHTPEETNHAGVYLGIHVHGSHEDHGEQVCDGCGVRIVDFIGGLDSVLGCEQPHFVCLSLLLSTNSASSLSHGPSPNVKVVMRCTCSPSSSFSLKLLGENCASLDAL
jgi:hypothetical protein